MPRRCRTKTAFPTRAAATWALHHQDDRTDLKWPVGVYKCRSCGYWHLTSRVRKPLQRTR